jgi:hypothetical protein
MSKQTSRAASKVVNSFGGTTSPVERELFEPDEDLEWFLVAGASAMRERGTMGSVISSLELGGHPGGVPSSDLYNEQQLGWRFHVIGDVERHRWLMASWVKLAPATQNVLMACYSAPMSAWRADQGFGARDACPSVEAITKGRADEPNRGKHQPTYTGVDARLGRLAMLCFALTENPAGLLQACRDPGYKGGSKIVKRAIKDAGLAAGDAHEAWREAKTGKPRKTRDRVSMAPKHVRPREVGE